MLRRRLSDCDRACPSVRRFGRPQRRRLSTTDATVIQDGLSLCSVGRCPTVQRWLRAGRQSCRRLEAAAVSRRPDGRSRRCREQSR